LPKRKSFATRVKSAARKRTATPRVASGNAPPAGSRSPLVPSASSPTAAPSRIHLPPQPSRRPQAEPDPGFVAVGRVLAPFGLKGELRVQVLTDNATRFQPKAKLWAGQQPISVAKAREAQGHLYLTLKGFPDRDSVERFRHALLQVPEADLPPLPEGEYYRFELIGLTVVDREGRVIGTLDEIIETGANDVYRVQSATGADVLLPALSDVVISVDLPAKRMVVDPPDWR
jgi:16S rRNA processing protein RimM